MRTRMFLLLALLTLLLTGCATLGGPTPAQQAGAAQADVLYQRGDFQGAARTWEAQVTPQTAPTLASDYHLRAAEAWHRAGQGARAAQQLALVRQNDLRGLDAARYNLLQGELALARDPQQALVIAAMLPQDLPPPLALRAVRLQAQAATALGDQAAAARARVRMDPLLSGAARQRNAQDIERLLVAQGVPALQRQARGMAADDPMLPWIARALRRVGSALPANLPQLNQPAGTLIAGAQQEGFHAYREVALLLPLSGPARLAGDAVAEGFFTAYYNAPAGQPRPLVHVYDTQGTPQGALVALQQAQAQGAELVIGPLLRDTVAAVFGADPGVPVLALNHPDGDVAVPRDSAEFGLMPEADGVQAAVRMQRMGLTRAVSFSGGSDNEQRAVQAFKAQFESTGGTVVSAQTLPQGSLDYAAQIQQAMSGMNGSTGIFIAVAPEVGRLLLPQLRVARLSQPVMATPQIYSGIASAMDKDLDGVQFPDAPWLYDAQSGLPSRARLQPELPVTRGRGARLFAFGMDAELIGPYYRWLQRHPGSYVAGATGQLSVDAQGHVQRTPIWVSFVNGVATPLTGALASGDATP